MRCASRPTRNPKPGTRNVFLMLCFLPFLGLAASDGYQWPTNASRMMTSSFGEYRSSHLHAGMDVKTWGTEGWSVFAVDSGWVEKIEVNPFSYGRSLRIRLLDGRAVLYAHLSRFAEPIEDIVRLEQRRADRHDIALEFDRGFLPVRRGQTVAFTGQTGAGPPHLHFEIWDENGDALNPMSVGFTVQDRIAPVISAVAFTPLDFGSHVDGAFTTRPVPLRRTARGDRIWERPVRCWGSVGVSFSAFDMADGCANRFSSYVARLLVDGRLVFTSRYDRFPQALGREVNLDRDHGLNTAGRGLFQKLYVDDGNRFGRSLHMGRVRRHGRLAGRARGHDGTAPPVPRPARNPHRSAGLRGQHGPGPRAGRNDDAGRLGAPRSFPGERLVRRHTRTVSPSGDGNDPFIRP
jgi:hypothetical protein